MWLCKDCGGLIWYHPRDGRCDTCIDAAYSFSGVRAQARTCQNKSSIPFLGHFGVPFGLGYNHDDCANYLVLRMSIPLDMARVIVEDLVKKTWPKGESWP